MNEINWETFDVLYWTGYQAPTPDAMRAYSQLGVCADLCIPFDNTPLPMSIGQAVNAAIAKHALTVEADCDDATDELDDDFWDNYHDLLGVQDAWRELFCELFDAPAALIYDTHDARRYHESMVK